MKEERFPSPGGGGCASSAVRSAGTERELQWLRGDAAAGL